MPMGPLGKTWVSDALLYGLPVVGLAAIVIALMFVGLLDRKSDTAVIDLRTIANATQLYERHSHHAPGSLEALVEAGDLEKLPLDPWGRPYLLEPADGGVRLSTLGRVLSQAVAKFGAMRGHPPHVSSFMDELVAAGELEKCPVDPWGRDYLVRLADQGCQIVTLGRDGAPGGSGADGDLGVDVNCSR